MIRPELQADRMAPAFEMVDERSGVVGRVAFSRACVDGHPRLKVLGLAWITVAPTHRGRGIASALIETGLARCKKMGFGAVVVQGHPAYFPRFGFSVASHFALDCDTEGPGAALMVMELRPGYLSGRGGTVSY